MPLQPSLPEHHPNDPAGQTPDDLGPGGLDVDENRTGHDTVYDEREDGRRSGGDKAHDRGESEPRQLAGEGYGGLFVCEFKYRVGVEWDCPAIGGLLRFFNDRREMETGSKTPPRAKPTPILDPPAGSDSGDHSARAPIPQSLDTPLCGTATL